MTYLKLDTWYLLNSLWMYLLLIHQKYYTMLVKTYGILCTIMSMVVSFIELLNINVN